MATFVLRCVLTLVALALVWGCQHPNANVATSSSGAWLSNTSETRELDGLNRRLTDAYEREDVATLRQLLSDTHLHNNVFGSRLTKEEFLKDIESGVLKFVSYNTPAVEWVRDGNVAVATGVIEAVAIRSGKQVPATRFRFTRIYRHEAGQWKVLLFQNTMMR